MQHLPFSQASTQQSLSAAQEPPIGRHLSQKLPRVGNGLQIPLQHSLSAVQEPVLFASLFGVQHLPLAQIVPLQQSVLVVQVPPFGMHIGVVDVEVVLVDVEVVLVEVLVVLLVVVVVVCPWQLPLEQFRLQHWSFLVQCLPLRLHPGGSPAASPAMPSDPSVPPRRAAPINLRA